MTLVKSDKNNGKLLHTSMIGVCQFVSSLCPWPSLCSLLEYLLSSYDHECLQDHFTSIISSSSTKFKFQDIVPNMIQY